MGYFSGLVALGGLAVMLFSVLDNSVNIFLLEHLDLVVGLILLIISFIGFLGTFKKDSN